MVKEISMKPPCREYDVQGIESWLQYQSLAGNHLFDTAGRTFYFKEGEAKKLVFRLEPSGKKRIDEEQKEDWKKKGWMYAASYRRLYDIFFSETEEREEAEALAASQSVGLQFLDQRFGSWRIWGIFFIAATAILCRLAWREELGTPLSFFYGSGLFAASQFVICLILWISVLVSGAWFKKQTEALKDGRPMPEEDYRHAMRKAGSFLKISEVLWSVLLLLCLAVNLSSSSGSLGETETRSDFLSLSRMEGEYYTPKLDLGETVEQHYLARKNPLVKKNFHVEQSGYKFQAQEELERYEKAGMSDGMASEREKAQEEAAEKGIPVRLEFYLYETRREEDAQKLIDQVHSKYIGSSQKAELYQKGIGEFDDASVIHMEGNRQIVCARGDNTAFILLYEGDLDMNNQLEYISQSAMAQNDSWKEELMK